MARPRRDPFHETSRNQIPICILFRNGSAGCLECAGGSWNVGSFREFAIETPSEAICVSEPHTSDGVALDLIATHRSQSLFGEVTKHSPAPALIRHSVAVAEPFHILKVFETMPTGGTSTSRLTNGAGPKSRSPFTGHDSLNPRGRRGRWSRLEMPPQSISRQTKMRRGVISRCQGLSLCTEGCLRHG